eukprot:2251740-Alexandrium_andersonii.AAC.1
MPPTPPSRGEPPLSHPGRAATGTLCPSPPNDRMPCRGPRGPHHPNQHVRGFSVDQAWPAL